METEHANRCRAWDCEEGPAVSMRLEINDCRSCPFDHMGVCVHPQTITEEVYAVPPADCGLRGGSALVVLNVHETSTRIRKDA